MFLSGSLVGRYLIHEVTVIQDLDDLNECYRYLSSLVQSAVNLLHHPHLSLLVLSLENSAGIKLQLFSRLIDACHYLG